VLIGVNLCQTERYLKKQSQCQNRQIVINSVIVNTYGDFGYFERFLAVKNKANQSQLSAFDRKFEARTALNRTRFEKTKPICFGSNLRKVLS